MLLAGLVLTVLLAISVRVVMEYERGVVPRPGRVIATRGSGLTFLIPFLDRMVRVSLRTVTMSIPPQDVITKDNVTARVNAVAYFNGVVPLRRAMARQAEAERDRRAKVIHAVGEFEAAGSLGRAAEVLEEHPAAMQLRVLSTMAELTSERSSTLVFPLPVELLRLVDALNHKLSDDATRAADTAARTDSTPGAVTANAGGGKQPSDQPWPASSRHLDRRAGRQ